MLNRLFVALFTLMLSISCHAETSLTSFIQSRCSKGCVSEASILNAVVPAAEAMNLDYKLLLAIISVESGFVLRAKNRGNMGLMQVLFPVHKAKFKGKDVFEPRANVMVGAGIFYQCMMKVSHVTASLRCYNGGADKKYPSKVLRERALLDLVDIPINP